ncbi:MAG: hypothetical protein QW253_02335 [Metallosphaera sp.]
MAKEGIIRSAATLLASSAFLKAKLRSCGEVKSYKNRGKAEAQDIKTVLIDNA